MNKTETIADIVADLRDRADNAAKAVKCPSPAAVAAMLANFAARIEAATAPQGNAAKCARCRENGLEDGEECEYYGDPAGCNSPIYGHHPAEQCNAAALRAALDEQLRYWDTHIRTRDEEEMRMRTVAALAVPPRNCDVGTAEEQLKRFDAWCNKYGTCSECPFDSPGGRCGVTWAQLPCEEGGDK